MTIKFAEFKQITRSRTLAVIVNENAMLRQAALDLVRSIYPPENGIRLVGVALSNFETTVVDPSDAMTLFVGTDGIPRETAKT